MKYLCALNGSSPTAGTILSLEPSGGDSKALLVVHQVGLHNLIEDVFVNRRVQQRDQRLDTPIEIARHEVRR